MIIRAERQIDRQNLIVRLKNKTKNGLNQSQVQKKIAYDITD